jgi:hypothetical protein
MNESSHLPNWTGLLGWSTKYHDGTSASQFGPMDAERRAWLEKALNSAFEGQEDPNQIMKKAGTEIQEGKVSSGLDMLEHVSDYLDCAENIDKLGALEELVKLLGTSDSKILRRATEVLNLYLPNNPRIQLAAALKYNCLGLLKNAIKLHSQDSVALTGCLASIGNLIRTVEPLEKGFIRDDGVGFILDCISDSGTVGSVHKVCSLIFSLTARHDLTCYHEKIARTLCPIYSEASFSGREVQMFEIMANVAVSCTKDEALSIALRSRRAWISSLSDEEMADYVGELELLEQVLPL